MTSHPMWEGSATIEYDFALLQAKGIHSIRFDVMWQWIEPSQKGVYDDTRLAKLDAVLASADAHGLRPIVVLLGTPTWAHDLSLTGQFVPPTNKQDFADFAGFMARRYASRGSMIYEVWNEPNQVVFWSTGPNPAEYTDLLRRAYVGIKSADSTAIVLGGALAFNDIQFLDAMYGAGAGGSFDGLSVHPYALFHGPLDRSDPYYCYRCTIEQMRGRLDAYGDSAKKIYITEIGWAIGDVLGDEQLRASYLRLAVQIARSYPYVASVQVETLRYDEEPPMGLLLTDGTLLPGFASYVDEVQHPSAWSDTPPIVNLVTPNESDVELDTAGFDARSGTILARTTEARYGGQSSLKVATDGTSAFQGVNMHVGRQIGQRTFSAYLMPATGAPVMRLAIWSNTDHASIAAVDVTLSSGWQRVQISVDVGSVAKDLTIVVETSWFPEATTVYADNLQLELGLTPNTWVRGSAPS
jgi:hypothetical protein